MAIKVKKGVSTRGLQACMYHAWNVAGEVYAEYGYDAILTSATGGTHSRTSFHYSGNAIDLRIRNVERVGEINMIADELQERLGDDYDVVLESTHIHVEFQPEGPLNA